MKFYKLKPVDNAVSIRLMNPFHVAQEPAFHNRFVTTIKIEHIKAVLIQDSLRQITAISYGTIDY